MSKKYLCGIDYQEEMEYGYADFYDSVEELKNKKRCWLKCGIVELELNESGNEIGHKWLFEQNLYDS